MARRITFTDLRDWTITVPDDDTRTPEEIIEAWNLGDDAGFLYCEDHGGELRFEQEDHVTLANGD